MAFQGTDDDVLRCISIDPGSNRCGFSVLDFNLVTNQTHVVCAETIRGEDLLKLTPRRAVVHGDREARNMGYADHLTKLLDAWEPYMVASEAPFQGKFVQTYKALTEQLTFFRGAIFRWDRAMRFFLVEPTPVKKFMGVRGNSPDKSLMQKALLARTDVSYADGIDPLKLDEHSIDSICVGLSRLHTRVFEEVLLK